IGSSSECRVPQLRHRRLSAAQLARLVLSFFDLLCQLDHDGQRCGKSPAPLCALAERSSDRKQLIFVAFDPVKGRGRELTRFDIDPTSDCLWDLSPDGTSIALLEMFQRHERHAVKRSEGPIHILSLSGRTGKEITVKGWNSFQSVNWAADGKALFVTSPTQSGSALLCLDLRGDAHLLWEQ